MNYAREFREWLLPHLPTWFLSFIAILRSKVVHIFLFLVVNAVVGSLGVWMPILVSVVRSDVIAHDELIKVLAACGPYTFAVAYLAASTSFVIYEYLDGMNSGNRKWKVTLALISFVLIILCTLLSALQTAPTAKVASPTLTVQETPASAIPQSLAAKAGTTLTFGEDVQLLLAALATLIGLALFVLSRLDDADIREELKNIAVRDKRETEDLMKRAEASSNSQLQL